MVGEGGGKPDRSKAAPRSGKPRWHRAKKPKAGTPRPVPVQPGLGARQLAVALIDGVIGRSQSFDEAFGGADKAGLVSTLEPRDRALARLIAATVLRRLGELEALIGAFLEKPLPARTGALKAILLAAAAQVAMIGTPAHAAISLAVDQTRADRRASRFSGLVNAVLRKVAAEAATRLAAMDRATLDIPAWMLDRWRQAYGVETARHIAEASLEEAALDLTVRSDATGWAERLGGTVLATGSVRLASGGRIDELPGFAEGAWWVQDSAAALPAKLLGNVAGKSVADICAAPGGKTAQLAAAGAKVVAVDRSADRLIRLEENLARLGLAAEAVTADAETWQPGRTFDAVLLDAPCTATGTIRRHPDILRLRRPGDVAQLAGIQARLLARAATLVRPGGTLIYCTCSLEPEEGPFRIVEFLGGHLDFERVAVAPGEIGDMAEWITADGDLRTLPCHSVPGDASGKGLDGFYAARLRRQV